MSRKPDPRSRACECGPDLGPGNAAQAVSPSLVDLPLIVQSDLAILLDVASPTYERARDLLAGFAQLEKSPEQIHTYRLTPLSLWNAAAVGMRFEAIVEGLTSLARYPVPPLVVAFIREQLSRYGRTRLSRLDEGHLLLATDDADLLATIGASEQVVPLLTERHPEGFVVSAGQRGALKQAMVHVGYPVDDLCGYTDGLPLAIRLRGVAGEGEAFALRHYQSAAVEAFHQDGSPRGGAGVIVLACGSGKTVVGIGAMARVGARTLVLTTGTMAVRQWIRELLDKTELSPDAIGEYTGERKDIRPVTVATYQMLTHRSERDGDFPHLALMKESAWGLIVYDEVHMLPAPVFRATAEIQARRRLGLTATLVREDGREDDVFALIGPKKFEVPWKELEGQGFIAEATCHEVRVEMPSALRVAYALAERRDRFRMASENPVKIRLVEDMLAENNDEPTLVIGQYIGQLEILARDLKLPLITGQTPQVDRERLYAAFRAGHVRVLVVSKVANFAIDLPDASLAIQISGTFGSRQEEAQRLGRILRPKARPARFYTLVSRDTIEQEFARKRQMFLVEQGYKYRIVEAGMGSPPRARMSTPATRARGRMRSA